MSAHFLGGSKQCIIWPVNISRSDASSLVPQKASNGTIGVT